MTTKMIAAIRANGSIIPVAEVPEWVLDMQHTGAKAASCRQRIGSEKTA